MKDHVGQGEPGNIVRRVLFQLRIARAVSDPPAQLVSGDRRDQGADLGIEGTQPVTGQILGDLGWLHPRRRAQGPRRELTGQRKVEPGVEHVRRKPDGQQICRGLMARQPVQDGRDLAQVMPDRPQHGLVIGDGHAGILPLRGASPPRLEPPVQRRATAFQPRHGDRQRPPHDHAQGF
ncbi:MAG: hypothetical protein AAGA05_04800 [Pseudomonadota bacterium]